MGNFLTIEVYRGIFPGVIYYWWGLYFALQVFSFTTHCIIIIHPVEQIIYVDFTPCICKNIATSQLI